MTSSHESLLSLLRAIVRGDQGVPPLMNVCWAKVKEEAARQGVQGLCLDAQELMPAEQRPDKEVLMQWLGQVVCLERLYETHRRAIDALSFFYQQNGINMMLLKGYGLSLYWPKPGHRPVGDMDIYLGGCWQQRTGLLVRGWASRWMTTMSIILVLYFKALVWRTTMTS